MVALNPLGSLRQVAFGTLVGSLLLTGSSYGATLGRVLVAGDSISEGEIDNNGDGVTDDLNGDGFYNNLDNQYQSAYRLRFAERMITAGISYDFVGSKQNGYTQADINNLNNLPSWARAFPNDDLDHEGTGGASAARIRNTITDANYLAAQQPDTVLLLVGINDIRNSSSVNVTTVANRVLGIADNLVNSTAYDVKNVYLSTLTPAFVDATPGDDSSYEATTRADIARIQADIDDFNQQITNAFGPGGIFESVTDVHLVDGFNAFAANNANLPDSIHPSSDAYDALGDAFADAVLGVIPEPSSALILTGVAGLAAMRRRRH
jgi:lysophospholipase L1-like esterase